ncbi:unnamed protein product [Enterobius vermicularis]|uniref:MANEC domain-containing protein n=1 Tax=Enterobius vermicularis TaxID=51028 RepID=A0A0N4V6T2_ENTVE|nr:unnamed protein product [Enterobius vermicularis]
MHRSEEFLMSDDSDVSELDLPSTGRQTDLRFFRSGKVPQDSVAKARKICTSKCFLMLLLISIVTAVVFLGVSHLRLLHQLEGILVLPRQLEIIKNKLRSMKNVNGSFDELDGRQLDVLINQVANLSKKFEEFVAKIDDLYKNCEKCRGSESLNVQSSGKDNGVKERNNKKSKRKRSKTGIGDDKSSNFGRVFKMFYGITCLVDNSACILIIRHNVGATSVLKLVQKFPTDFLHKRQYLYYSLVYFGMSS